MPPENAIRSIVLGTAATAVTVATLTLPQHPGSAATGTLEARRLPLRASSGDARDAMSFSLVTQHEAAARIAGDERAAHLLHLEHVRHVDHLEHVVAVRLEMASARRPYAGQHRREAAPPPAPAAPVLTADTGSGESPEAYAESVVGSGEYGCLYDLWMRESGWQADATNPGSGAYGIPQSLPASKMASAGADWRTNPITQVKWGLEYIDGTYGTPCAAWSHEQSDGWY
jgi:hypothetical protein